MKMENISMKYRPELPLVLKNVNAEFKPCERIGIVGKTGSGKSSLVGTCYRLYSLIGEG